MNHRVLLTQWQNTVILHATLSTTHLALLKVFVCFRVFQGRLGNQVSVADEVQEAQAKGHHSVMQHNSHLISRCGDVSGKCMRSL
jgi:C4-dicarboxylate-specific signal transduction histidine kinase